jgi:hypothetical protein
MTTPATSKRMIMILTAAAGVCAGAAPAAAGPKDRGVRSDLVWVPDRYEQRVRTVIEPAVYENRARFWVEPVYRVEQVRVPVPAVYELRTRRVWDPPVTRIDKVPVVEPAVYEMRMVAHRDGSRIEWRKEQVLVRPARTSYVDRIVEIKPGGWRTITEQVCVQPATVRIEERRVCVQAGYWTTTGQPVLVRPEVRREVVESVLVEPAHFELAVGAWKHGKGGGFSLKFGFAK